VCVCVFIERDKKRGDARAARYIKYICVRMPLSRYSLVQVLRAASAAAREPIVVAMLVNCADSFQALKARTLPVAKHGYEF
jgi:hypothetical protein